MRAGRRALAGALLLVVSGCAAGGTDTEGRATGPASTGAAPSPSIVSPDASHRPRSASSAPQPSRSPSARGPSAARTHPRPSLDTWVVGAHPLPLRPDGFGRIRPTPPQLRVRRMPTVDLLPVPPGGRFGSRVGRVTPAIRRRMGRTWSPRCPVRLRDLRYVTVSFWGFDHRPHTGELVVNARAAGDLVRVFRRLYRARFPIEEMRLPTTRDLEAPPTGDGNDTAALVCRATRTTTTWSAHAYGLAIDVNPFMNPYHKGDLVLPELASAYLDRSWRRPGMILRGGVVTRAFAAVGWTWGGDYSALKDRMHFSANGR